MPILDGRKVDADQIDPAKHRCIGMWRPPAIPEKFNIPHSEKTAKSSFTMPTKEKVASECPCGSRINEPSHFPNAEASEPFQHWHKGCFDEPQYLTIVVEDRAPPDLSLMGTEVIAGAFVSEPEDKPCHF